MAVHYELNEHCVTITLDRPEALNAIDLDTWRAFAEATERLENDDAAWVGIITGAGDRAFSAGADIATTIPHLLAARGTSLDEPPTIMRGQQVTKPLIAAINGHALGGGFEIALACDIRIAAENARLGAPEVKLGLIPGWGATQRLIRELTWARAAAILLSGDPISAQEALEIGLLNAVVPAGEALPEAQRWADRLCKAGPLAVRAAKRAMSEGYGLPLAEGLAREQAAFFSLAGTNDVAEGLRAFAEKRPPEFTAT
jgi:enoyl-CoA hydratase/carnithine racemase